MTAVRFARRALGEAARIDGWWRANREASPRLFASELAEAVRILRASPALGPPYVDGHSPGVRRLLLRETRYFVYYSHEPRADEVVVLAIWATQRERGPRLR